MSCTIKKQYDRTASFGNDTHGCCWIFSLAKTLVLPAVFAWLSVNHGAVKLVDKFVHCREHAFANSDR